MPPEDHEAPGIHAGLNLFRPTVHITPTGAEAPHPAPQTQNGLGGGGPRLRSVCGHAMDVASERVEHRMNADDAG